MFAFSSPGSTQPLTENSTKEFPWGKVRPALRLENSAAQVALNVKVRVEDQHSIPSWVFMTCHREAYEVLSLFLCLLGWRWMTSHKMQPAHFPLRLTRRPQTTQVGVSVSGIQYRDWIIRVRHIFANLICCDSIAGLDTSQEQYCWSNALGSNPRTRKCRNDYTDCFVYRTNVTALNLAVSLKFTAIFEGHFLHDAKFEIFNKVLPRLLWWLVSDGSPLGEHFVEVPTEPCTLVWSELCISC